jgi:acetyl esterase/lipase
MKLLPLLAFAVTPALAGTVEKDIPYFANGEPRQTLDLYLPAKKFARPVPLVVWIHGGAWKLGTKDWINVPYLVDEGFAIASIGYRFSQNAKFPAQIQDCNAALNFLLKNAEKYGLDPESVIIGGGSAGGHLALLLGLARNRADWDANPKFRAAAILDFFGVTDISTAKKGFSDAKWLAEVDSIYLQLLGALPADRPDIAKDASPINYVTSDAPKVLIVHGGNDDKVPLDQSKALVEKLKAAGVLHTLFVFEGAGHDGIAFEDPKVQATVRKFLKDILKKSP